MSFTCPRCARTSHSPEDAREGYCGACHDWTGAIRGLVGNPFASPDYDHHYDRDGDRITLARWAWLMERGPDYKVVARDDVDLFTVSTVWLGLDHGFGYSDKPIIFETMVFLEGTVEDTYMERYATEHAAREGHARIVWEIRFRTEQAALNERRADQKQEGARDEPD